MRFVHSCRALPALIALSAAVVLFAQPAAAGFDEGIKALQAGDVATAEKELQLLVKERDPRA